MHEPGCMRDCCIQPRVSEVCVLCAWPESNGKCAREHPKHAYAAHQITMLKGTGAICNEVVEVEAASDATADQGAMNRTDNGK
jgi:hypothetical protein